MTTDLTNIEVGVRFDNDPSHNFHKEILEVLRKEDFGALIKAKCSNDEKPFYAYMRDCGDGSFATFLSCKEDDSEKLEEFKSYFDDKPFGGLPKA